MNYSKGLVDRTKELLDLNTQAEMAEHFGVSRKQVSEWRVGNATPPFAKMILIAKEHNVNLNWFFFGVGKKYLTPEEMVELHQDIKNNNQLLILNEDLSEQDKQILNVIIDCSPYVPKAFLQKVVKKILDYKKQFKDDIASFDED